MALIAPIDATFLAGETREHPMHVGGLLLFETPPVPVVTSSATCTGIY